MELKIQIDDRVGDKVLVLSSAQYVQYQADPAAFLAWLEKTGRLPEPPPVKPVIDNIKKRITGRRR